MSFIERKIDMEFRLGQGDFGESGYDTVTLSGYRCAVHIEQAGLPFLAQARARIFGVPLSIMNQLSTLGGNPYLAGRQNEILISAGDAESGMTQVFQGVIANGYQDYTAMPEVSFFVEGLSGGLDLVKPSAATSFSESIDVATILKGLAARMTPPLTFENFGVSVILSNPYLYGTLIDQIRTAAYAANINSEIYNGTLAIWPRNSPRPVPKYTISPETGLVGYPTFNGAQIIALRTMFNPALQFGSAITVKSSLQPACGDWYCSSMTHNLESQTPGGAWFTDLEVMSLKYFQGQPAN